MYIIHIVFDTSKCDTSLNFIELNEDKVQGDGARFSGLPRLNGGGRS